MPAKNYFANIFQQDQFQIIIEYKYQIFYIEMYSSIFQLYITFRKIYAKLDFNSYALEWNNCDWNLTG